MGRDNRVRFRILIVEDDRTLAGGLCRALQNEDTETISCGTLQEAGILLSRKQGTEEKFALMVICVGEYRFDFMQMKFYHGKEQIELSKTEQKLLHILVENRGITIPRERLFEYIWAEGEEFVEENALSVTVKRLRDKLDAQEIIKTVYGIGYTWVMQ